MFEVIEKRLNKKTVCVIFVIIILFPFVLNEILIQDNKCFSFVGNSETWLNFWPTYLSSIASFIMAYIAFISLRQVQCQMEEAHIKEEERKRANLKIDIVKGDDYNYYVRFRNVGHEDAYNIIVKIDIDEVFYECIKSKGRDVILSIQKSPFFVPAQETMLFYIGGVSTIDHKCESNNYCMSFDVQYNSRYNLHEVININEFVCKQYGSPRISYDTIFKIWFEGQFINGRVINDFKILVESVKKMSDSIDDVLQYRNETILPQNKSKYNKRKKKR